MNKWYLVYCKARQEDAAARGLEEQGYAVYLPKLRLRRRRRGVATEVEQPLFPRYLFVAPSGSTQSIGPAQFTAGVQNLVRFGTLYLPVPQHVVTALREREDPEIGCHRLEPPVMQRGDRVRIDSGAFKGIEGVFEVRTGRDRVIILLNLLGQQTRTEISLEDIER